VRPARLNLSLPGNPSRSLSVVFGVVPGNRQDAAQVHGREVDVREGMGRLGREDRSPIPPSN
jgi:hypothetical protein